ncbi:MAG: SsrA-binding protein SmpB [Clostridia bacterium]|nr:SsrA-binding protein SmpB [Clostridia bacterium]
MKIITVNKKAGFDYFVEETFEAGIVLEGSEVKSCRQGNVNLRDSFALIRDGQVWLKNAHISPYEHQSAYNSKDPRRDRKLLLHKSEIRKMVGKIQQKGYTLVAMKMYFKDALVKVELALCRGKQAHDKKDAIRARDLDRAAQREIADFK